MTQSNSGNPIGTSTLFINHRSARSPKCFPSISRFDDNAVFFRLVSLPPHPLKQGTDGEQAKLVEAESSNVMKQSRFVEHVVKAQERVVIPKDRCFGHFRVMLERGVEARSLKILMRSIPVTFLRRIMSGLMFRMNVSAWSFVHP